jgi:hypothetical protein
MQSVRPWASWPGGGKESRCDVVEEVFARELLADSGLGMDMAGSVTTGAVERVETTCPINVPCSVFALTFCDAPKRGTSGRVPAAPSLPSICGVNRPRPSSLQ